MYNLYCSHVIHINIVVDYNKLKRKKRIKLKKKKKIDNK